MKKIIALALCVTLSACGGSSSESPAPVVENIPEGGTGGSTGTDTGTDNTASQYFTVRTVNHLRSALVCADTNANLICEADEELGDTDENGFFEVDESHKGKTLIVKTEINKTIDLQTQLGVQQPYTLYATSTVDFISPLSTLSIDSGLSMSELATLWQLPIDIVSGDYIDAIAGENAAHAYVVTAIANFVRDQLKDGQLIASFPERIASAMPDVLAAIQSGVSLGNLIFEKDQNGIIVTNLDKPLIEYVDYNIMAGSWNTYHFGGISEDTFGTLEVDPSEFTRQYCTYSAKLNGSTPLSTEGHPECTTLSFNEGVVNIGMDDVLQLVYGHTSSKGTVLIFKAKTYQSINLLDNGYVWFDNFNLDVSVGQSLSESQWFGREFANLGYDDLGVWGEYSFNLSDGGDIEFSYSNERTVTGDWSLEDSVQYLSGVSISGKSVAYVDSVDDKSHKYTMYRVGDFLSIGLVDHDGVLEFVLASPNSAIIETVSKDQLVMGSVTDFIKF